jgi:hypothetical protein
MAASSSECVTFYSSITGDRRRMLQGVASVCFEFVSLVWEVLSKTAKKHKGNGRPWRISSKASSVHKSEAIFLEGKRCFSR